jgi:hypothetical protein
MVTCKTCSNLSISSEARAGYCKDCKSKKLGRKAQRKIISEKYKGVNNPNYVSGKSKMSERQSTRFKSLRKKY